jgi:glycosyltransferase involved in cell wall biosynthesis
MSSDAFTPGADSSVARTVSSDGVAAESTTPESPSVVVGIPAYNAACSVGDVVAAALPHADLVIVVDDGSTDDTAERAASAGATVVAHEENGGYGAALKTIFAEAADRGAECLVVLDADGQHDTGDIPRLVDAHERTGADVVIASRFADDGATDAPLYRRVGLGVINLLTNVSLGTLRSGRITDTQSGFRAYSARAMASLAEDDSIGDRMDASLDILYHVRGLNYDIAEVGTTITYDVEQASSDDPLSHGLELVSAILSRTVRSSR